MKAYIGIDPGTTGALAIIDADQKIIGIHDWQELNDDSGAADIVIHYMALYDVSAAIELVHSMPKQGVSSTFKFADNYGTWKGILAGLRVPRTLVRPQTWQKGIISKADGKRATLATARRLWPDAELTLVKHHNRADALLIADWLRRQP